MPCDRLPVPENVGDQDDPVEQRHRVGQTLHQPSQKAALGDFPLRAQRSGTRAKINSQVWSYLGKAAATSRPESTAAKI